MAINSFNGSGLPGVQLGYSASNPVLSGGGIVPPGGSLSNTLTPQQVMGLVPLYDCCYTTTIPGTSGCQNLTFTVTGNTWGGSLYIQFITTTGIHQAGYVNFSTPNMSCHDIAVATVTEINNFDSPYTCALVGNPDSSCTIQICIPSTADPQYFGAKVIIQCGASPYKGTITTNLGCPATFTLGTSSSTVGGIDGCGDCRQGNYLPDIVPDDRTLQLTVFADPTTSGYLTSDYNSWLLQYPIGYDAVGSGDFTLQKLINGVWTIEKTLNDSTLGLPFNNSLGAHHWPFRLGGLPFVGSVPSCTLANFQGYFLDWRLVYNTYGAGVYRFAVNGRTYGSQGQGQDYCKASQPFCLSKWDCHAADHTVKLETTVTGGNRGSVTQQGIYWSLSCNDSNPFFWADSIRFYGFFGRQGDDLIRDQIKYQPGTINKIRDELIKKYELWISPMPQWFHDRISAYALMADQLYVTDDNYNNANYNLKHFWVAADSGYEPAHKFESRYARIEGTVKFKEGQQFVFADRC